MRTAFLLLLLQVLIGKSVYAIPQEADSSRYTGFVVALAWPKAWAKEAGDGYDRLLRGLGFNDGGFYRVGHAALILVNGLDSSCHYFDFGRYHTPVGMGRVRSAETDHELVITTKAIPKAKRIDNLTEILCEVQSNACTHGSGPLYSSYVRIDFDKAFKAAKRMQNSGATPYGPFEENGLNCSRFVREVILSGDVNWAHALRLRVVPMITPTTLYPVSALYHWTKVPGCLNENAEKSKEELSALPDSLFRDVLPEPERVSSVPKTAQWLSGEAAGSWYDLIKQEDYFLLTRYAPAGEQQCAAQMKQTEGENWSGKGSFAITYMSHCREVNLIVKQKPVRLQAID